LLHCAKEKTGLKYGDSTKAFNPNDSSVALQIGFKSPVNAFKSLYETYLVVSETPKREIKRNWLI
jgi:hypothetical protein